MKIQQESELLLGGLTQGACQGEFVDPEWWVGDHGGTQHAHCHHQDARHICIAHCPVRAACRKVADDNPDLWLGMVIAGELRVSRADSGRSSRKPAAVSVALPTLQCYLCPRD